MKKIVCLGGGNAMPKAVLSGLKKRRVALTAICAMLDTGGSSGRLRKDYQIVAPGDIRRAFIALANTSPVIEDLFNYRFETGQLRGHNFANLFITALELSTGDYKKTVKELNKMLKLTHTVLPITLNNSEIYAVLENNKKIKGETNIDCPKHDPSLKIKKVFLKPLPTIYHQSKKALRSADLVIIGPGDLYSSLAQILLVDGVKQVLRKKKILYICNSMTKRGETNNYMVEDFVAEVEKWLERSLDYVLYNNQPVCKPKGCAEKVVYRRNQEKSKKYIGADLLKGINHDPQKVATAIMKICRQLS